jgi:hypothetical protein
MKVSLLYISLLFTSLFSIGQVTVVGYNIIGNESSEYSTDIDTLGEFLYLTGNTNECGSNDGFILKYKEDSIYKRRIVGTESIDVIESIETTNTDTLFVGGFTNRNNDYDIFIAKLDTQLNIIKTKELEIEHWNFCYDLVIDGNEVLGVGKTHNGVDYDAFIFKVNSNLDTVWTKTIESSRNQQLKKVIAYNDSIYIACGYTEIDGLEKDVYLVSINANTGDTLWTKNIGGLNDDFCNSIIKTSDGGIVGFGTTSSYVSTSEDYMLFKVDGSGNFVWSELHQTQNGIGVYNDRGIDLIELQNGDLVVASMTESFGGPAVKSTMIMLTNSLGWWLNGYIHDGGHDDYPTAMIKVSDTAFYISGIANSQTSGYTDSYIMKMKSVNVNNTISIKNKEVSRYCFTGIEEEETELFNVYPNPISENYFTISSVKDMELRVTIFDLLGNVIYNKYEYTNSEIQLPVRFPNGNYFIKIESETNSVFKSIIYLNN